MELFKKVGLALLLTLVIPVLGIGYAFYVTTVVFATLPLTIMDAKAAVKIEDPAWLTWLTAQMS